MKEFLLKFPIIYRFYQNTVRKKNHEYDFFKYFFKKVCKKHERRERLGTILSRTRSSQKFVQILPTLKDFFKG